MIAIIDTDGTITIHPIAYEAWRSFAQAHPDACEPGMVVLGPGIDGTIRITPRPATAFDTYDGPADAPASDAPPAKRARTPKASAPECFDGAPLLAFLRAADGPQTMGQLCKAFKMEPPAMRAALDSVGAIKSGKAKGTRYSAPPDGNGAVLDMPAHLDEEG